MANDLVLEQIDNFLQSGASEALAIKGRWGVGKTYTWNSCVERKKEQCFYKDYSYVSLFGVKSLDELKQLIFLNSVSVYKVGELPNVKTYSKKLAGLFKDTKIPYVSRYTGGVGSLISSVSQLSVNNMIICFDDLERHSNSLEVKDLLGLINYLKEQKKCKIVLLLNEDTNEESYKAYQTYKEKVIDREITFSPSSSQSFDVMFPRGFSYSEYTRDCCDSLGINNKRIIRKIGGYVNDLITLDNNFDEVIKNQIVATLVLLSWCYYSHGEDVNNIPDFRFVTDENHRFKYQEETGVWTKEQVNLWLDILNRYGYMAVDELDLAIASGIEKGYFDKKKISMLCSHKQSEIDVKKGSPKWDEAWSLFHNSFDDNKTAIVNAMTEGLKDIVNRASCFQYSGGLHLLRVLGEDDLANEMIDNFIEARSFEPKIFNIDDYENHPFGIQDSEFKERLREQYHKLNPEPTVEQILELRKDQSSYNIEEVEIFNRLSEDDIYVMFKSFNGEGLTRYIRVFWLLSGSSKELRCKIISALNKISSESTLNSERMAKFKFYTQYNEDG